MATKEVKVCDIYGTTHKVQRVGIAIKIGEESDMHAIGTRDMSPRAQARLLSAIERALRPSKSMEAKNDAE